jgi:TetR/AcrR family transcriptional regulator, tetracycline repressor protein
MPRRKPRKPGERAGLDRSEILFTARRIVAAHGVTALTLRKLATALGVAPNALYSHFTDKRALLDALLDALLAEIPARDDDTDWRRALLVMLGATRRLLVAHEALIPLFLSRPGAGPNARRLGDAMRRLLERAGLTGTDLAETMHVLLIFTLGFAAHEAPRRHRPPHAGGRHPDDKTFDRGLGWLLDGVGRVHLYR